MTRSRCEAAELRTVLPATLQAIERFFTEFRRWQPGMMVCSDAFAAELLLREVLTNAVVHGCGQDPSKQVRCALRARPGRLTIAVADDGLGFDWRAAANRTAEFGETSGRGMEILRAYANRVRFNAPGNSVTIWKRLRKNPI